MSRGEDHSSAAAQWAQRFRERERIEREQRDRVEWLYWLEREGTA